MKIFCLIGKEKNNRYFYYVEETVYGKHFFSKRFSKNVNLVIPFTSKEAAEETARRYNNFQRKQATA